MNLIWCISAFALINGTYQQFVVLPNKEKQNKLEFQTEQYENNLKTNENNIGITLKSFEIQTANCENNSIDHNLKDSRTFNSDREILKNQVENPESDFKNLSVSIKNLVKKLVESSENLENLEKSLESTEKNLESTEESLESTEKRSKNTEETVENFEKSMENQKKNRKIDDKQKIDSLKLNDNVKTRKSHKSPFKSHINPRFLLGNLLPAGFGFGINVQNPLDPFGLSNFISQVLNNLSAGFGFNINIG